MSLTANILIAIVIFAFFISPLGIRVLKLKNYHGSTTKEANTEPSNITNTSNTTEESSEQILEAYRNQLDFRAVLSVPLKGL